MECEQEQQFQLTSYRSPKILQFLDFNSAILYIIYIYIWLFQSKSVANYKLLTCCGEGDTHTHTQRVETAAVGSVVLFRVIPKLGQQMQFSSCRTSGLSWPMKPCVLWQNFTRNLKQILFDLFQLVSRKSIMVSVTLPPLKGRRRKLYVRNHLCTGLVSRVPRSLEQL